MKRDQLYRVIYLWRGERHVLLNIFNAEDAKLQIGYLAKEGLQGWAEPLKSHKDFTTK